MTKLEALKAAQQAAIDKLLESDGLAVDDITIQREADGSFSVRGLRSKFGWKIIAQPDGFELVSDGHPIKRFYFPFDNPKASDTRMIRSVSGAVSKRHQRN